MIDIMLDAGHGGHDPGAVGPTGLRESDVNLQIALAVGEILTRNGVTVGYTRTTNVFVSVGDRARIANNASALNFLSIHINGFSDPAAHGTETFAFQPGADSERLARAVQKHLIRAIGLRDRGVKFANFQVLRETNMPAALVEVAFISNPREEALMRTPEFIRNASQGIADGVMEYLGRATVAPEPPAPAEHWAEQYWQFLNDNGVTVHERRFDEPMTRGEMVAIVARAMQAYMDA